MNLWYVYVMANKPKGVLYGGCTNNIEERKKEHKWKIYLNSFTAEYNCDNLMYFEEINDGLAATVRELQLKKWKRDWKINLIENMNPSWSDLSINLNLNFNKLRDE